MAEREELDRHVMFFPEEGAYVWRVVRSEEHLAEERLAEEVRAFKVNRSDRRAATSPAPLVRPLAPLRDLRKLTPGERRRLKLGQQSLFGPGPDVGVDGKRV